MSKIFQAQLEEDNPADLGQLEEGGEGALHESVQPECYHQLYVQEFHLVIY